LFNAASRSRWFFDLKEVDMLARIKDLASKEFSLDAAALDPAARLDSLGIDSLSFIEFMFKIEEEFGVSVSDEDLKRIKTLADLERHVAAALASAGKA
jgi:acyl carrier protein